MRIGLIPLSKVGTNRTTSILCQSMYAGLVGTISNFRKDTSANYAKTGD